MFVDNGLLYMLPKIKKFAMTTHYTEKDGVAPGK